MNLGETSGITKEVVKEPRLIDSKVFPDIGKIRQPEK